MQGIMENTNQRYEYERYLWGKAGMPILIFE